MAGHLRALEPEQLDEVELRAAHQSAVDAALVFADRLAEQASIIPPDMARLVLFAASYGDARRLVRTFRKQLEIAGGS